jgi:superfamily II DNA or RNA helicase
VETIKYYLSDDEKKLYNAVTEYVEKHFNKALDKEKRNVTFALTVLQRRLASSARAIKKSLERRHDRLKELYAKGQIIQEVGFDEDYLEDLEESERWKKEEELLEKLTSAETLEELKEEIGKLEELVAISKEVEKKEVETKLTELKKVMDAQHLQESKTKLLIFTESKDTLDYLVEKLTKWGYSVTFIHGGMNLDRRIKAENDFRNQAQIMVSTEAGGEGINLQFCWLMVNYDIPWNPNRLEQRMGRVHRYGQQHEVHIYNLVAVDTREGRILERLFEKLSQIREHLGSDRVFDVVGEILVGRNLKDLIVDAISNRRTMEDILRDFERIPDEVAIKKVKEASLEALATRHIDLTRILGEQRRAKENRLVPEYVEEFFKRGGKVLNIKMEKRQDGFWHISSVPFEIRNQPYEFKIKFGEIQKEYSRISFDKDKAFKGQAEFVAMGHPLLEACVGNILTQYGHIAGEGATFIAPEGRRDGVIWFSEAEIKDGSGSIVGKRLLAVYQKAEADGQPLSFVNPAILWDLKPLTTEDGSNERIPGSERHIDSMDVDAIRSFLITQGLDDYKKELLERRQRDAGIKRKYGIRSLESMVLDSEAKISDYETRRMKGENIPEATIQNEIRKKEDLDRKRQSLIKEIEAEIHLYPTEPKIIGAVRVLPGKAPKEMIPDEDIERIGMDFTLRYEETQGRKPEDVHLENLGYDIRSKDQTASFRYIEVKARAKEGAIALRESNRCQVYTFHS